MRGTSLTTVRDLAVSVKRMVLSLAAHFAHKAINKLTWASPDIINGKWRQSLQNEQVRRYADVGINHSLLEAKLRLKFRKAKIGGDT